ncbi:MAG: ketoacyl-ACP synthase III [Phycisphaerales bacterium]|nr:ketoacyl-ACP synthase III [Phycisphaerales bacterium]
MKTSWAVEIAGMGSWTPPKVVTNDDLAARLDTSDEWITQRTGIRARHISADGETTLHLAEKAAREALAAADLTPADLDLIVVCTVTPEHTLPSTSCELQAALGCGWIPAFDLVAACSGFVYGLTTAAQFIHAGTAKTVLVVGAETMTRVTDQDDRATAILFGDAAGAAILRPATQAGREILAVNLGADGARAKMIWTPAGGSCLPASDTTVAERLHHMRMSGREVYKFAVTQMQTVLSQTLADAGVATDDVTLLIPHQSNLRIIESACDKIGIPMDRVMVNIDRYGNTSAASVPLAMCEAWRAGRIKRGDLVMMLGFGAGLTWGSALLRL